MKKTNANSRILREIHKDVTDWFKAGIIDLAKMQKFDLLCKIGRVKKKLGRKIKR